LANNTTYYWRVKAKNAGGASVWSSVWSFTTIIVAPTAPALASPTNGAVNRPTTLTLSWNPATGAETYRLQVSTSSAFTTPVFDDSTITSTSRQIGPLANNTAYYWRVKAKNTGGASAWSSVWSFTTIIAAPTTPTLISPANGAGNQLTTLTLSWNPAIGATTYRLQISANAAFTTTIFDDSTNATTSRQIGSLTNNTTYYWRVKAKNAGGASAWSSVWSFMTGTTAVSERGKVTPTEFSLNQNYPNPFNPSTTILYALPKTVFVRLTVFNPLGKEVETLLSTTQVAGEYEIHWSPNNLTSGVYLYRLQAGDFVETKKMILMR
jgi:transposase-like protein